MYCGCMQQYGSGFFIACDGDKTDALCESGALSVNDLETRGPVGALPIIDRKRHSRIIPGFLRVKGCRLQLQWPWYQS